MNPLCVLLPYHWGAAQGGAEYQAHLFSEYVHERSANGVAYLARHIPAETGRWAYSIEGFAGPQLVGGAKWGMSLDSLSLYKALTRINPAAILQMVAGAYTGIAAAFAKRKGIPLFFYLASDMDVARYPNVGVESPVRLIDRMLYSYGRSRADYVVAQTETQSQMLLEGRGRAADIVVPNFLPPEHQPIRKDGDIIRVLWIANFKKLKQPELFLDLAESFSDVPNVEFVMIGRSSSDGWGSGVLARAQSVSNLTYLGELPVEDVESALSTAHIFVNTSEYEGFPNTFIQSWLRKVPTLSLNVDPAGILEREGFGRRTGTLEAMRCSIETYLRDRSLLEAHGEAAQEFALQHYSLGNAERLLEFIRTHSDFR